MIEVSIDLTGDTIIAVVVLVVVSNSLSDSLEIADKNCSLRRLYRAELLVKPIGMPIVNEYAQLTKL